MRFIYIGFSSPKGYKIGAEAIKMWTKSPYSHAYFRFQSSNKMIPSTVYQASHGMVHFREFSKFKMDNVVIKEYALPVSDELHAKILAHCMFLSGDKYGYLDLANIVAVDATYWLTGKDLKIKDAKGYICSELVGKILKEDFNIEFKRPVHLLRPNHVDKKLAESYKAVYNEFI